MDEKSKEKEENKIKNNKDLKKDKKDVDKSEKKEEKNENLGKVIIEEKAKKQIEEVENKKEESKFEKVEKKNEQKDKKTEKIENPKESNEPKETKLNKAILIVLLVLVILVIAVGIIFGGRIINKAKLDKELENLSEKNIETDDFSDLSTVTSGDFGVVEQTVKQYYQEYSDLRKKFMEKVNDERIQKMLTVENYREDGPEFTESKEYINNSKEEFNQIADNLLELLSKENIEARIDSQNIDEYYKNLYKGYFIDNENLSETFQTSYQDTVDAKALMNNLYDNEIKILDFLTENQENWEILNNKLTFDSATLSVEYNTLKTQLYAN